LLRVNRGNRRASNDRDKDDNRGKIQPLAYDVRFNDQHSDLLDADVDTDHDDPEEPVIDREERGALPEGDDGCRYDRNQRANRRYRV